MSRSTAARGRVRFGRTFLSGRRAAYTLLLSASAAAQGLEFLEEFSQPTASFSYNGSARHDGVNGCALVCPNAGYAAGSVFHTEPFAMEQFEAAFDFWIGGGSGADGLTFGVVTSAPTALGSSGGYLGWEGIQGGLFSIEFDTYPNGWDPSDNHVGLNMGSSVGSRQANSTIPELRGSWFHARIEFFAGALRVWLGNSALGYGPELVLQTTDIPFNEGQSCYVGFTAATGMSTDEHRVDNFSFTARLNPPFRRGDANGDGGRDIADVVTLLSFLFEDGERPPCMDAADADDRGSVNLNDAIALLNHLFGVADVLPEPFGTCGVDETPDQFGCLRFSPCE